MFTDRDEINNLCHLKPWNWKVYVASSIYFKKREIVTSDFKLDIVVFVPLDGFQLHCFVRSKRIVHSAFAIIPSQFRTQPLLRHAHIARFNVRLGRTRSHQLPFRDTTPRALCRSFPQEMVNRPNLVNEGLPVRKQGDYTKKVVGKHHFASAN